eukprot:TRINITY_DN1320_c0_g1_i1.p1 TRINITY_DN1320_c0_g1~~TRINITY_DN1320_c0_g1_i1.p1  ORF type:complete len:543 (+),score=135.37 TRINITY_DN1320_c0_g1_i1:66-1694(+)
MNFKEINFDKIKFEEPSFEQSTKLEFNFKPDTFFEISNEHLSYSDNEIVLGSIKNTEKKENSQVENQKNSKNKFLLDDENFNFNVDVIDDTSDRPKSRFTDIGAFDDFEPLKIDFEAQYYLPKSDCNLFKIDNTLSKNIQSSLQKLFTMHNVTSNIFLKKVYTSLKHRYFSFFDLNTNFFTSKQKKNEFKRNFELAGNNIYRVIDLEGNFKTLRIFPEIDVMNNLNLKPSVMKYCIPGISQIECVKVEKLLNDEFNSILVVERFHKHSFSLAKFFNKHNINVSNFFRMLSQVLSLLYQVHKKGEAFLSLDVHRILLSYFNGQIMLNGFGLGHVFRFREDLSLKEQQREDLRDLGCIIEDLSQKYFSNDPEYVKLEDLIDYFINTVDLTVEMALTKFVLELSDSFTHHLASTDILFDSIHTLFDCDRISRIFFKLHSIIAHEPIINENKNEVIQYSTEGRTNPIETFNLIHLFWKQIFGNNFSGRPVMDPQLVWEIFNLLETKCDSSITLIDAQGSKIVVTYKNLAYAIQSYWECLCDPFNKS